MICKFLKQNVLFLKGLNWVQHWVSQLGLCLILTSITFFQNVKARTLHNNVSETGCSQLTNVWTEKSVLIWLIFIYINNPSDDRVSSRTTRSCGQWLFSFVFGWYCRSSKLSIKHFYLVKRTHCRRGIYTQFTKFVFLILHLYSISWLFFSFWLTG